MNSMSRPTLAPGVEASVQAWRSRAVPDAVFVKGVTRSYAVDPIAECVLGLITDGAMLARRGRERYILRQGDLALWDASGRHGGTPHGGDFWAARLVILPFPAVEDILDDPDLPSRPVVFDSPRLRDPELARRFLAFHRATHEPVDALTQSVPLHDWFQHLVGGRPQERSVRRARRDGALRRACELLKDDPTSNVTLDQLAAVANTSRHRLSRLFRTAYGCPPHQFLLAQRLRLAKESLMNGMAITEAAQRAGFTDQSHLHRHLKRSHGFTPREYQKLRSNVQERIRAAR